MPSYNCVFNSLSPSECVSKLSHHWFRYYCLQPFRRQAIIWTNSGLLLIEILGTNFSEIVIKIRKFSRKMHLKMSSAKKMAILLSRPQCVNAYIYIYVYTYQLLLSAIGYRRNVEWTGNVEVQRNSNINNPNLKLWQALLYNNVTTEGRVGVQ